MIAPNRPRTQASQGGPPAAHVPLPPDWRCLTIREVAERLDCSRRHIYDLVSQGDLPAVHAGRLTRVMEHDLEAYVQRQRLPASAAVLPAASPTVPRVPQVTPKAARGGTPAGWPTAAEWEHGWKADDAGHEAGHDADNGRAR